jgi:hypothetical protein
MPLLYDKMRYSVDLSVVRSSVGIQKSVQIPSYDDFSSSSLSRPNRAAVPVRAIVLLVLAKVFWSSVGVGWLAGDVAGGCHCA